MEKPVKRLNFNLESSKKGQALAELAIFGSILLFCLAMLIQYGLDANYQQQAQMQAFRKAQKIAFYRDGPGAASSLTLIKDKPTPDPRDQWGLAERSPVIGASNSIAWNTNLSAEYIKQYTEPPKPQDLPVMYFEVDHLNDADRPSEASATPTLLSDSGSNAFGFYTARFERIPCLPGGSITVEIPNPDPRQTRANISEYIHKEINCEQIKVMRIEGGVFGGEEEVYTHNELLMQPYFQDAGGIKHRITAADVDGDTKLENVIAANADEDGNNIEFMYIDSNEGGPTHPRGTVVAGGLPIDTGYIYLDPRDMIWDTSMGAYRPVRSTDKQGLLQDFEKTIKHTGTTLTKTESGGTIASTTHRNAEQVVIHKIRLNDGQAPLKLPVRFPVHDDVYHW